jgi:hypothetical protein
MFLRVRSDARNMSSSSRNSDRGDGRSGFEFGRTWIETGTMGFVRGRRDMSAKELFSPALSSSVFFKRQVE